MLDFVQGGSAKVDPTAADAPVIRSQVPEDGAELISPVVEELPPPAAGKVPPTPNAKVVPKRGTGQFTVAPGGSPTVGKGKLLSYRVEVENGSGESPSAFAAQVDSTLADPRSWTARGQWAFRRVSAGRSDFVVRLTTPDTVDKICGAAGLATAGYSSCRTGEFVVVNLARWELAVPDYRGDIALYRRYVINHEVGHRLGFGHELCPGNGRLAPIMQQQTYGLNGCTPNGWPFVGGRYVAGPPTDAD
jgi:hypothetical protein